MRQTALKMKLDHVTLAGQNLAELRKAFTATTGIPTEDGGPHSDHVTEMALASFPDGSYLELIGIRREADPAAVAAHTWSQFLRDNAGPCAFAIQMAEPGTGASSSTPSSTPTKGGRTRPDGVKLSWETARMGSGPLGSFFPFLIRDLTPREDRVYPSGKPTSARYRGIGLVVLGVRNLKGSIEQYQKAFQLPAPKRQRDERFGGDLAWFEDSPVVLAEPLASSSWLAHRIERLGDSPCAIVFTAAGGLIGQRSPDWFGHPTFWSADQTFGWRLGAWITGMWIR
jgi:Glyoxalase-like domain